MKPSLAYACTAVLTLTAVGLTHAAGQETLESISVESAAFENGGMIPVEFTADGKNVSPPLSWSRLPEGTQEIALIVEDPDAPTAQPFVHWLVYKIPGTATGLPSGVPPGATVNLPGFAGASQGVTGFGIQREGSAPIAPGYRGPAPPPGSAHHYHFKVYALNSPIVAAEVLDKASLLEAMDGKLIGEGALVGLYERQPN